MHERARLNIERRTEQQVKNANKYWREVVFEPRDWVWVHMRKERFLAQSKSKLASRSDGPFQVVKRINNNAYQLDLPSEYAISLTFNVFDLSPYFEKFRFEDKSFWRRNDEDIDPNDHLEDKVAKAPEEFDRLMTRARVKRFKESLNSFIQKYFEGQEIVHVLILGVSTWFKWKIEIIYFEIIIIIIVIRLFSIFSILVNYCNLFYFVNPGYL